MNQPEPKNRNEYFRNYRKQHAEDVRQYNFSYYWKNHETIRQRQNRYYRNARRLPKPIAI